MNSNRNKRIRTTFARLRRHNRALRRHLSSYRHGLIGSAVAAVALAAVLGFMLVEERQPDAVLLGEGSAGLKVDSVLVLDEPAAEQPVEREIASGEASYYGDELAGQPTASGEAFDPAGMTAAHRSLPIGSRVRVTNLRNGQSVVVRINDRGPFSAHRVIDLSQAAASRLGMLGAGTAMVRLHLLDNAAD